MTNSRNVLTSRKCPPSEGLKFKIVLTRIGVHEHVHTCNPSIPSPSTLLCPVSVMDGESVAYSCIQLTNCPSPSTAAPLCDLWKTGRDRMSRQLRLKKGTEDTDKLVWKRCIWRKLYIWGLTGRQGANELRNMGDTFWQWHCCVVDYENFPLVYLYGGI